MQIDKSDIEILKTFKTINGECVVEIKQLSSGRIVSGKNKQQVKAYKEAVKFLELRNKADEIRKNK